jgi:lysophospholipase L1-like esterase
MQTIVSNQSSFIPSPQVADNFLSQLESKTQQPLRIVAIGDSVVYGYGDYVGGGWVERLRRRWMSPGRNERVLYNLGVRGDRVSDVGGRLELEFGSRGELRNKVPDVILLSVGTNDSPRLGKADGKFFTEFTDFQQQITNLLDLGSALAPVLFIGMTPVDESKMPFLNCLYYNQLDQYRYKEATLKACQERNIPYLDIFDLWLSRGESWLKQQYSEDGLHPNVEGYENLLNDILAWQTLG